MQIKGRRETIEDCARQRAKLLIRGLRDQTCMKEILEELGDKNKRDKLWDIYLGKTSDFNEKHNRAETLRIKNIERQLAVLNKNRLIMNDVIIPDSTITKVREQHSDSLSISEWNRSRTRRRSSLDQQILEQWKLLADEAKGIDQLPWSIRRVMIRRHFRRHLKDTSPPRMSHCKDETTSQYNDDNILELSHSPNSSIKDVQEDHNNNDNHYKMECEHLLNEPSIFKRTAKSADIFDTTKNLSNQHGEQYELSSSDGHKPYLTWFNRTSSILPSVLIHPSIANNRVCSTSHITVNIEPADDDVLSEIKQHQHSKC
ncbi:unnamed protein product [Didymodactylos carnosus]|uniref:Uncharacterized protein n=1 Tax=Didymodactylos carnosus TaxID=1234261 RepID=A0A813UXH0_9BILA|nr:unnamed protein product [Didymodactylos carnosus]CAF3623698.1 unnamed protein product [Didymodactylos carnosus]